MNLLSSSECFSLSSFIPTTWPLVAYTAHNILIPCPGRFLCYSAVECSGACVNYGMPVPSVPDAGLLHLSALQPLPLLSMGLFLFLGVCLQ